MTESTDDAISYPFTEGGELELGAAYADARKRAGLTRVKLAYGEPAWLVTRYADARLVLGDQRFSTNLATQHDWPRVIPTQPDMGILGADAPDHTRLRKLVGRVFTYARVEELRPWVREVAENLLDGLKSRGGTADLTEEFALPLSIQVICQLLGVPVTDRPKFRPWTEWAFSTDPISPEDFQATYLAFYTYMASLLAERRKEPQDDLISSLAEGTDAAAEPELVGLCLSLLLAGHETTASLLPDIVEILLERPAEWQRLLDDPALIPSAAEELTRFIPLLRGATFPRYAKEDVEVGGTVVKAGEAVLVSINAANRDPGQFEEPDELRLNREPNQHLGYSYGLHHCLGMQLARLEIQEALRALLGKMPGLRIAGETVPKSETAIRGFTKYVVGW